MKILNKTNAQGILMILGLQSNMFFGTFEALSRPFAFSTSKINTSPFTCRLRTKHNQQILHLNLSLILSREVGLASDEYGVIDL